MNPIAAIRELMETYTEGVRVSKFGPDYDLKRQQLELDMQQSKAKEARSVLDSQREGEYHGVRMSAAQRAEEDAQLKRATAIAEAAKHGHAGDLTGIADHDSEQNLQEGKLKVDRENARIAADQARRDSYKSRPQMDQLRMNLIRAQTARAQASTAAAQRKADLEVKRLEQQLSGTYNPDLNAQDPTKPTRDVGFKASSSDLRELAELEIEREGGDPEDAEAVIDKMAELAARGRGGSSKPDAPVESGTPAPQVTQAPKLAPSQAGPPPGAKTATNPKTGEKVWWNGSAWVPVK